MQPDNTIRRTARVASNPHAYTVPSGSDAVLVLSHAVPSGPGPGWAWTTSETAGRSDAHGDTPPPRGDARIDPARAVGRLGVRRAVDAVEPVTADYQVAPWGQAAWCQVRAISYEVLLDMPVAGAETVSGALGRRVGLAGGASTLTVGGRTHGSSGGCSGAAGEGVTISDGGTRPEPPAYGLFIDGLGVVGLSARGGR